jgi:hypothetical protein
MLRWSTVLEINNGLPVRSSKPRIPASLVDRNSESHWLDLVSWPFSSLLEKENSCRAGMSTV